MMNAVAGHWKLTATNWEWSLKPILLQLHEKLLHNSTSTVLWSFGIWSKLESSLSKCLVSPLKIKKKMSFLKCDLIICNNNKIFLNQIVMCNEQWILYDNWWWPAQWLDREVPKQFPTPNLHKKMVMVTVWWSAVRLIHYSFLNSSGNFTSEKYDQQINEMPQKLRCLQLAFINRKGAILLHDNTQPHVSQPTLRKLSKLGYEVLPYLPCSPHLLPTDYHFFKHLDSFLQGKHFHKPAGGRKCFPRVHWIPKHGFLCYRNIG